MAIRFKVDILEELKKKGFTTYRMRNDKAITHPINQAAMQRLRTGKLISWEQFGNVCNMLEVQPGDLIEYVKDKE